MADFYRVSRGTIRLALGALETEGLIERTPRVGTIVREHLKLTYYAARSEASQRTSTMTADEFFSDIEHAGRTASQDFECKIESANSTVAAALDLDEDEAVVVRRCSRYIDGVAASIESTYFPRDISVGTDLESPRDIERGSMRVLAELGHKPVGFSDAITARAATVAEEHWFGRAGVIVIELNRTDYSAERPTSTTQTVYDASLSRLVYELDDLSAKYREDQQAD